MIKMSNSGYIVVGISQYGVKVVYGPIGSHAATHLHGTSGLQSLVSELISKMELDGQEVETHVDMGRVVGTSDVIDVDDSDEIDYGVRKKRYSDGLVPFTKSRQNRPCPYVAVHLVPQSDESYVLSSA